MIYSHRQTSIKALLLVIPIAAIVAASFLYLAKDPKPPVWLLAGILIFMLIATAVFSTLTVEVKDGELAFGFLFGVLRRRIPLADIARAERVTLPWWYGTGLKYAKGRMSYLVFPGPAVLIEHRDGRLIQIGTEDATSLLAALAQSGVRTG